MNIGIDIRCLTEPERTGVGEYAYQLLNTIFTLDKTNHYFLWYNSAADCAQFVPKWEGENIHYVVTRWPNKLLNSSFFLVHRPYLDAVIAKKHPASQFVARPPLGSGSGAHENSAGRKNTKTQKHTLSLDYFFSPNLNFISLSPEVKHILTIHDLSFEFFPDCFTRRQRLWHTAVRPRRQCRQAHLVLTPSANTKRDVSEYYGVAEEKVKAVYPGVTCKEQGARSKEQLFIVKQKYSLPDKFIFFLGTVEPRKNIFGILEAYKQIWSSLLAPCSLIIAGPLGWKYESILAAIRETPGARYIGYVPESDKGALYQLASLFVYPSLYEGFGFPVLEAMAAGTPVVTSSRSSLPEVVGEAGYLVNPMNVAAIAEGMQRVLTDGGVRSLLVARGREQVKRFTWQKAAQDWLGLL